MIVRSSSRGPSLTLQFLPFSGYEPALCLEAFLAEQVASLEWANKRITRPSHP